MGRCRDVKSEVAVSVFTCFSFMFLSLFPGPVCLSFPYPERRNGIGFPTAVEFGGDTHTISHLPPVSDWVFVQAFFLFVIYDDNLRVNVGQALFMLCRKSIFILRIRVKLIRTTIFIHFFRL